MQPYLPLLFTFVLAVCFFVLCMSLYLYLKGREAKKRLKQRLQQYRPQNSEISNDKDTVLFVKQRHIPIETKLNDFLSKKSNLPRLYKVFMQNKILPYVATLPLFIVLWTIAIFIVMHAMKLGFLVSLVIAGGVALTISYYIFDFLDRRQERAYLKIFPLALDIISRGLKAGITIEKTFATIVHEVDNPVKGSFQHVLDQMNFGISFEQALRNTAKRLQIIEFYFFVSVLVLQKKTGGSSSDLVAGIAHVLRAREELRKKIGAMSAEAKTTGWIVGSLPIIAFIVLSTMRPEYIEIFQNDPLGHKLFLAVIALLTASAVVIKKMVSFKDL